MRRTLKHTSYPLLADGRRSASELQVLGQRALDAVGARLVIFFLTFGLVGILVSGRGRPAWEIVSCLATGVCLFVLVDVLRQRRPVPWLIAALTTAVLAGVVLAYASRFVDLGQLHQVAAWLAGGVAGGICLSRGPRWGLAAFVAVVGSNLVVEHSLGGPAPALTFLPTLAYYLGTGAVNVMARRGFASTDRALSAAEAAAVAQQVAQERWDASRRADRQLHDTVLATLTILAHRSTGLAEDDVRAACARDVRFLQGATPSPASATARELLPQPDPSQDGTASAVIRAALGKAEVAGLDVRLHSSGDGWRAVGVAREVATALNEALDECLVNIQRHASVRAFDVLVSVSEGALVVVIVDEGSGFDPATVPPDRLGLRASVRDRLSEVGGSATIWSTPGMGTSVMLRVPVAESAATVGVSE